MNLLACKIQMNENREEITSFEFHEYWFEYQLV